MVNLTINGTAVQAPEGATILEAAAAAGISVPTLCFLKGINEIGACRVCLVELEGTEKLVTACNNRAEEGMVLFTNSPRVREARRTNVELILSQHDCFCATCVRSGNCGLQSLSNDLGIPDLPYRREPLRSPWNPEFPLIRDFSKCIKCMRCIQVCDKIQGMNIWDVANTGSRTTVDVSHNRRIEHSDCALCGQCITHCPVGALRERDDTDKAFAALADPETVTVVQIAPAVRAAWGESLGIPRARATVKRLAAALRRMGFDYIFDTTFSADLTIMEEGSELLERMKNKADGNFPMFTSCCPGWVRFVKARHPEMAEHLSTAKSPQQMFGAVIKSDYARRFGLDPEKIRCISVMPCIAKKYECALPQMDSGGTGRDVDLVLTTREVDRMIRAEQIQADELEEEELDAPLGLGTGAGVIFGAAGGVMEAALRSAHYLVTGKNPAPDDFREVRGMDGWRESVFELAGKPLRVASASGLANAEKLVRAIRSGRVSYDFVEIMACPGGCSGGGGQPIHEGYAPAPERAETLYALDRKNPLRFSHENPAIVRIYEDFLGKPMSRLSHELLHTDQREWELVPLV